MHWVAKYIGKKHATGGRGPEAYDCWGLVKAVYADEFGIPLPDIPGISVAAALTRHSCIQEMAREWNRVNEPFDGCAVGMSQKSSIHHVGLFVAAERGKIVHCWDSQRVIADDLMGIYLKGFRVVNFYRHRLWPSS